MQTNGTTSSTSTSNSTSRTDLISSDRVEGTEVYGSNREHIGEIHSLMIDKVSGRIAYALMSFGGFLGLGKNYYPIPWSKLTYDVAEGGYRTDLTESQISNAPGYTQDQSIDDNMNTRLYDYYSAPYYW